METSPAKKKAIKDPPVNIDTPNRDKSQSQNRHMEVDNPQIPGIQETSRIPFLDRKLSRGISLSNLSSQSKGKTGNTKFQL